MAQWLPARISGRVASSDKLDSLKPHKLLLLPSPCPVESVVFHHLPEERDHPLGAVVVHVRQVDLVAEHDQPDAKLHWREDHSIWCLSILAIVVEGLEQELRGGCRAKVESNDLHVRKGSQCREEGHGLARTRGPAEDHWLVLCQPGVQKRLMSHLNNLLIDSELRKDHDDDSPCPRWVQQCQGRQLCESQPPLGAPWLTRAPSLQTWSPDNRIMVTHWTVNLNVQSVQLSYLKQETSK